MNEELYMKFMRIGALKSAMRSLSDAMLYDEKNNELSKAYNVILNELNMTKAKLKAQDK